MERELKGGGSENWGTGSPCSSSQYSMKTMNMHSHTAIGEMDDDDDDDRRNG